MTVRSFAKRLLGRVLPWYGHDANHRAIYLILKKTLKANSNCIDVGCNEGQFLRNILRFAPSGQHFGFDANAHLAEKASHSFPGIKVHAAAVGDHDGTSEFHVIDSNPGFSGFKLRGTGRAEKTRAINVPVVKLDTVIPRDVDIDLIKIDVEGAEYQVVKGAETLIQRCQPVVIFEHGLGGSDIYGTTPDMMFEFFVERCGMEIFSIHSLKPFTIEGFRECYQANDEWDFVAVPSNRKHALKAA